MESKIISGVVVFLLLTLCSTSTLANVTNYETEGNLESPKPAGCISVSELTNQQNPVDIFTGLNTCLINHDYKNAAELYFAGMSYGLFDAKRVSDNTAHQAIIVLRMNVFSSQSQDVMEKLQTELTKITSENTEICRSLINLGAPVYYPNYMVQHGIRAFTDQGKTDGLIEHFDSGSAWKEVLSASVKCA